MIYVRKKETSNTPQKYEYFICLPGVRDPIELDISMILSDFPINKVSPDDIIDVIHNAPATIVKWKDGTKTIVKCQPGDKYDKEAGLAFAICKKVFGNKGNYNEVFKKWVD